MLSVGAAIVRCSPKIAFRMCTYVNSLKNLAVEAVYKETLYKVIAAFKASESDSSDEDQSPASKKKAKLEVPPESVLLSSRRQRLDAIKKRLNGYLLGPFSDVKHHIFQRFIDTYCCKPQVDHNICLAFFNCLLDDSFKECVFTNTSGHPFCLLEPVQLLGVIGQHSPKVETLAFDFGLHTATVPFNPAFSLSPFKFLTNLNVSWKAPAGTDWIPFCASLGNVCPRLSILQLDDISFGTLELISLLLGPRLELFPQELLDEMATENYSTKLSCLEFSPNCLTPICSTLKQLKHSHSLSLDDAMACRCWDNYVIFVLRHLRQLQVFKHDCIRQTTPWSQTAAVIFLHQEQLEERSETSDSTFTTSSNHLGTIQWTFNSHFTGRLNLVKLKSIVSVRSLKNMQAITALCPHLRAVKFEASPELYNWPEEILSVDELRSLLLPASADSTNCWSKIDSIVLFDVPLAYRRVLLQFVCSVKLRKLSLFYCLDIDPLVEFLPFDCLESLILSEGCGMATIDSLRTLSALSVPFLPILNRLVVSGTCLGDWSRLFECNRPSLNTLFLSCSHIGIASKSPFNWEDIPNLWPNLQCLHLDKTTGLTVNKLRDIIPLFHHLAALSLPDRMIESPEDRQRAFLLSMFLRYRLFSMPSIILHFRSSLGAEDDVPCLFDH